MQSTWKKIFCKKKKKKSSSKYSVCKFNTYVSVKPFMQPSNDQIKGPKNLNLNTWNWTKIIKYFQVTYLILTVTFNNKNMGGFTRHFVPYIDHSINVHDTHFVNKIKNTKNSLHFCCKRVYIFHNTANLLLQTGIALNFCVHANYYFFFSSAQTTEILKLSLQTWLQLKFAQESTYQSLGVKGSASEHSRNIWYSKVCTVNRNILFFYSIAGNNFSLSTIAPPEMHPPFLKIVRKYFTLWHSQLLCQFCEVSVSW